MPHTYQPNLYLTSTCQMPDLNDLNYSSSKDINAALKKSPQKTKLVGVLNITPDSFSDGNKFFEPEKAVNRLKFMLNSGASIIDIGAESTRPQSFVLTAKQEWERLERFLPEIVATVKAFNEKNQQEVQLSIDSYHFENLVKAWEMGVEIINDVSGLADKNLVSFIAKKNITAVLMHNLGIHANPEIVVNKHVNVIQEILQWTQKSLEFLEENGVEKSQLIFDPGIGFSKDYDQSLRILKNIDDFFVLGLPIFIGHSRKSCLDKMEIKDTWPYSQNMPDFGLDKNSRDYKTLALSSLLIEKNVSFLRVHDVESHQKLLLNRLN